MSTWDPSQSDDRYFVKPGLNVSYWVFDTQHEQHIACHSKSEALRIAAELNGAASECIYCNAPVPNRLDVCKRCHER